VLGNQLPGQTPGHADVAEVVDDGAKISAGFHFRHSRLPLAKAPIVRINYPAQKADGD
jgi:hypothetical protein